MFLTREKKVQQIEDIKNKIKKANSIIVWDFFGNNSNSISYIKSNVAKLNAEDIVYKNRIAKIAFERSNKNEILEHLTGPSAFLFIYDKENKALKVLDKYFKEKKEYGYKVGYIDGKFYLKESIKEIASLPSKNELLAMFLSTLQGTMRNFAYLLSQIEKDKDK
ncbi:MAG: 50S ribosomal protein L10 [Candidatus Hepatoplasma vulgare]|nr:MAG: 50S ribosomal protein L10 [Candidatus Hepatoplasma sp.]